MTYEEFLSEWKDPGKSFITAHTSGSTGEPKEIELSKGFVLESALRTIDFFDIDSHSLLHSCISPDFIGGKMMAVRASVAGCSLSWEKPSNCPLSGLDISQPVTLLAVVPSQIPHILVHKDSFPEIKNIIVGGAPVNDGLKRKIIDSGLNVFETYGMTETSSHVALRKITYDSEWFHTLGNIKVRIGSDSCLVIDMPGWNPINTHDIAELKNNFEFKIKGRKDNIIITGGMKVNPEEVERKLDGLFDGDILVTSVNDEKWSRRVVLKYDGTPRFPDEELMKSMKRVLAPHEMPKALIKVVSFERTANGKIKRN